MTIYWSQDDLPALRGLSAAEKAAVIKSVRAKVFGHWQVWLPCTLFIIAAFAVVFLVPPFEGRKFYFLATASLLGRLLYLPYNNYLQFHLEREKNSEM